MDTRSWRSAVLCDWRVLEVAPLEYRSDHELVLEVCRSNGLALQWAPEAIRRDPIVALTAVVRTEAALLHCHQELRDDVDFVLEAVRGNQQVLNYATDHLLANRSFMLNAVQLNWRAIELAVEALQNDPEIVFCAAKQNVKGLSSCSQELLGNYKFMHSIVKLNWKALPYAALEVRANKDVVLSAVLQDWLALQSAAPALQENVEFMCQACLANRDALPYCVKLFFSNRDFWVGLVRTFPDGVALFVQYYGEGELQNDKILMLELTKSDWRAFQIASLELRSTEVLQMEGVCQCWEAVKWAKQVQLPVMQECVRQHWSSVELFLDVDGPREGGYLSNPDRIALANSNPDIVQSPLLADDDVTVLAAVKKKGPVLKYASKRLQAMRPTATVAIRQNWRALEFASDQLRSDKPLVMETLKQNGLALQFAEEVLRVDHSVVMEAVTRNRKALPFMSKKLHRDSAFWGAVTLRFADGWKMAKEFGLADMRLV